VAGIEDISGDGVPDLLASTGPDLLTGGRVYVFSGADGALVRTLANGSWDFGSAVAAVGDVNDDGIEDVIVGDREVFGNGRAHLFSGADGAPIHSFVSPNPITNGGFGASVSGVGDVDGDGVPDLAVGARRELGDTDVRSGRAYVFSGATGALLHELSSPFPEAGGLFGLVGIGPANGGEAYVVIGAQGEDGGEEQNAGRAYRVTFPRTVAGEPSPEPATALAVSPNPFSSRTTLAFEVPAAAFVRLAVYDVLGRTVAVLVDGKVGAGRHEATLDGASLPAGTYLIRLEAGSEVQTRPLTLMR
jgi:hypothetical protein